MHTGFELLGRVGVYSPVIVMNPIVCLWYYTMRWGGMAGTLCFFVGPARNVTSGDALWRL